jgi:hypothetical protein
MTTEARGVLTGSIPACGQARTQRNASKPVSFVLGARCFDYAGRRPAVDARSGASGLAEIGRHSEGVAEVKLRAMTSRGLWGAKRPPTDPRLKSAAWKRTREHWKLEGRRLGIPCWRCGLAIDWDADYFRTALDGRRKVNGLAFALGHITGRDLGASLGWTDEQISDISNTRPEHARCSGRSGYKYQQAKRLLALASTQTAASAPATGRPTKYQGTQLSPRPVTQAAAADRW